MVIRPDGQRRTALPGRNAIQIPGKARAQLTIDLYTRARPMSGAQYRHPVLSILQRISWLQCGFQDLEDIIRVIPKQLEVQLKQYNKLSSNVMQTSSIDERATMILKPGKQRPVLSGLFPRPGRSTAVTAQAAWQNMLTLQLDVTLQSDVTF